MTTTSVFWVPLPPHQKVFFSYSVWYKIAAFSSALFLSSVTLEVRNTRLCPCLKSTSTEMLAYVYYVRKGLWKQRWFKTNASQMLNDCIVSNSRPKYTTNSKAKSKKMQAIHRYFPLCEIWYVFCVCVQSLTIKWFYLPFTNGHARADSLLGDSNQAIDKFGRRGWPNPKPLDSLPLFFLVRHVWCFSGSQLHWWHSFLSYFDCICGFCSSLLLKHWYGLTLSIMSSSGLHDTEQM